jgi:hypothetical protein
MDGLVRGNCPECGKLFESYGPSSLSLTIGCHLYEEHNYPTRFWSNSSPLTASRHPALAAAPGPADMPFDAAFYDGARLSPYDRGSFLRPLHICWTAPAGWPAEQA